MVAVRMWTIVKPKKKRGLRWITDIQDNYCGEEGGKHIFLIE